MASALDLLLVVPRPNVVDALVAFQANSGSYDMVAKVFYYSLQLVPIIARDSKSHSVAIANNLVKSLLNLRMLINLQRYPYTVRLLFRALEGNAARLPVPIYVLSVIMFALRVVEQTTGDMIYYHLMFPELHRYLSGTALNWRYKFFKCWANIVTVIVELFRLSRKKAEEQELRVDFRAPLTVAGGVVVTESDAEREERQQHIVARIRSVRAEQDSTRVSLFCSFLEIWVYLRWATWYQPPAFLPPLCGALSSCIGTYYLWKRCTTLEPPPPPQREMMSRRGSKASPQQTQVLINTSTESRRE